MGKGPRTLVDDLAEETLVEMAETFFGSRVEIERLQTRVHELASELGGRLSRVRRAAALLGRLLLDPASAERFYAQLNVPAEPFLKLAEQGRDEEPRAYKSPWGLLPKGRWVKSVLGAYGILREEVDVYLHGRYEQDPKDPRRKRLSVNYRAVSELADAVNRSIAQSNEGDRPSDVMRYMRSLDPMEQEKERLTGATLEGYDQRIDESMALKPMDIDSLGLVKLPELPHSTAARERLGPFLASLYTERKAEIRALMGQLKSMSGHAPGEDADAS